MRDRRKRNELKCSKITNIGNPSAWLSPLPGKAFPPPQKAPHPVDVQFLTFLNMETISFKKHEIEIWYFLIEPKESLPPLPTHPPTPPYHPLLAYTCCGGTAWPERRNCRQGILGGGKGVKRFSSWFVVASRIYLGTTIELKSRLFVKNIEEQFRGNNN